VTDILKEALTNAAVGTLGATIALTLFGILRRYI
jgi:hypothetical protein